MMRCIAMYPTKIRRKIMTATDIGLGLTLALSVHAAFMWFQNGGGAG